MNKIKKTTLRDRFANAIKAFKGKPFASLQFGIDVKRCDKCEYRDTSIRDEYLVTAGALAAYASDNGLIDIPSAEEDEYENAMFGYFIVNRVDYYLNELEDVCFEDWFTETLIEDYGCREKE